MTRWLSIIGIGEDGIAGLREPARRLIADAALVIGGVRHLALASPLIRHDQLAWCSPIEASFDAILARRGAPTVVLASGDPFFFGVGSTLMAHIAADEMLCLPQPSSFSLAAARLGWGLQDTSLVSIHGRPMPRIIRDLRHGARILALAWDGSSASLLAKLLTDRGYGRSTLHVMEVLGGPRERVRSFDASSYDAGETDALTILGIDCVADAGARQMPLAPGLPDDWFEQDGQMTKRELRALALSALRPMPGQLLWDVGGGAGSIAIEWLLRHETMQAIAVERVAERCARIARNALALGAPDLKIIEGEAPGSLVGQPEPDAIFVGGGTSNVQLLETCWQALKTGGVMVAHAVTLEGSEALSSFSTKKGGEIIRVSLERLEPVGQYRALKPGMPVVQWAARK